MSKNNVVFKRYEKKYLLSGEQHRAFLERSAGELTEDGFARSKISNLYLDTPDYLLIRRSLEKPVFKEKLRVRSYGTPSVSDEVFVELKRKIKGEVYKRRAAMPLYMAAQYLAGSGRPESSQITDEIDWFLKLYPGLDARMFIYYERHSLKGIDCPELRVTFDRDIRWRETELRLSAGTHGAELLDEGQVLMELKLPGAMPLWLSSILCELEIYPQSFSKYGRAYLAALGGEQRNLKEGVICA